MNDSKARGRVLLFWGVGVYTLVIVTPVLWTLINTGAAWDSLGIYVALSVLTSPWLTLRGSNNARTLAGIAALLGALVSLPMSCATIVPEARIYGVMALAFFPLFCFLTNVFLLNKHFQEYVVSVRASRGLSADHWRLDDRP